MRQVDHSMSFLNRAIGTVAPATALRRHAAQLQLRAYLSGADTGRHTGDWRKIGVDAEDVWQSDGGKLRERARFLCTANQYAKAALDTLFEMMVGTGIHTQCRIHFTDDVKKNDLANQAVEDQKKRWMEYDCDSAGDGYAKMNWYEMQELVSRSSMRDGEVLVIRRTQRKPTSGVPLAYQIVDASRLSTSAFKSATGGEIADGIEYDGLGRPVAYHIDANSGYQTKTEIIPARFVNHIFRRDWVDQRRGWSWFAPVIPSIYQVSDVIEYALIARKVQSAIALIITQSGMGGGTIPGFGGDTDANTVKKQYIEPGLILREPNGATVHSHVPTPSSDLDQLTALLLRGVAAGLGLSYEYLSGNYSAMNFAGGRIAGLSTKRHAEWGNAWFVRAHERPFHRDWVDYATLANVIPIAPRQADQYAAEFSRPRIEFAVNPQQEVRSALLRMDAGLSSLQQEIENGGGDIGETLTSIQRSIARGDAADLVIHQALRADDFTGGDTDG